MDTTFVPGTVVASSWLNDVNRITYRNIANITALRALSNIVETKTNVLGYYTAGDGGGGLYYLDPADTTSPDNGGTIIVSTAGGRWKLVYTDEVTLKQFGAKGDGVTNDFSVLVAASTAVASTVDLVASAGNYYINTTGSITKNIKFKDGAKFTLPTGITLTLTSVTANPTQQIFALSGTARIAGLFGSTVYAEWWGAKGDGTTNDSAAFNAARGTRRTLQLLDPSAGYNLASAILLDVSNFTIIGANTRTNIIHNGNFDLFTYTASDVTIKNLWIDSQNVTIPLAYEFKLNTATLTLQRIYIENVITWQSRGFLTDTAGTGSVITLTVKNCVPKKHSGPGIAMTRGFAYLHFHDVTIDYVGSGFPTFNAFNFSGAQGILFDNCDTTGSAGAGTGATPSQAGFVLNNCAGVWFEKAQADTMEGRGFELINCSGIQFNDSVASLCASGVGFYFQGCADITGNIRNSGRAGQSYAPAGIHGVALGSGNARFQLTVQSNFSTGDGINLTGPVGFTADIQAFGNIGYGLRSDTTGGVHIGAASFGANTAGNYNIGAAGHGITRAQLNSGAFVGPITGPATA